MIAMRDILKCRDMIAEKYNISKQDSARVVALFNVGKVDGVQISEPSQDKIMQILENDFSSVPAAAAAVGVKILGGSGKKNSSHCEKKTEKRKTSRAGSGVNTRTKKPSAGQQDDRETDGATVETVTGDIIAETAAGVLPDNVPALIMDVIQSYCDQNNISDLSKERQPRWRAACFMVGQSVFKNSKILHDIQREKINGGIVYDVGRVSALVDVWGVLCANFCKAPMIDDFAHFAAVSDTWLYGANSPDGLTPTRAALLQKIKRIQESGLSALIVDGRQNPTGALAALNHWHGWTTTKEIIHTTGAVTAAAPALPVFDVSGGLIAENVDKLPE